MRNQFQLSYNLHQTTHRTSNTESPLGREGMTTRKSDTKEVHNFVDESFGFPIIFKSVKMRKIMNEWVPIIDYNKLEDALIRAMPEKPALLTGAEIKFIRLHFGMKLKEFAEHLEVTHQAVMKWESKCQEPTNMSWSTEVAIRLFTTRRLNPGYDAKFVKAFTKLFDNLEKRPKQSDQPWSIKSEKASKVELAPA